MQDEQKAWEQGFVLVAFRSMRLWHIRQVNSPAWDSGEMQNARSSPMPLMMISDDDLYWFEG